MYFFLVGKGLFIIEASRSHSDTPHSVELLWMNDRSDANTCRLPDNNQHSQQTDIHTSDGIRNCKSGKRAATVIDSNMFKNIKP